MNIQFLVSALIIGKLVDWVCQTQNQAAHKHEWSKGSDLSTSWFSLIIHSMSYGIVTTALLMLTLGITFNYSLCLILLIVSHALIDNRILVGWIMRIKGVPKDQLRNPDYAFLAIGIDQTLHDSVLLALAFIM